MKLHITIFIKKDVIHITQDLALIPKYYCDIHSSPFLSKNITIPLTYSGLLQCPFFIVYDAHIASVLCAVSFVLSV